MITNSLTPCLDADCPLYIVVPAAGSGTRMNQTLPKQYLPLLDKTIIEHTIEQLLAIKRIEGVFVAIQKDDNHWPSLAIAKHPKVSTVTGGASRGDSVLNALDALPAGNNRWVLVHDAARPCVTLSDIERLIQKVIGSSCGGILATPVVDTLKQTSHGKIVKTIARDLMYQAQTPQLFAVDTLVAAINKAHQQKLTITDEASAIELEGIMPIIVEGSPRNIKVTVNSDLALAHYYLQNR